METSSGNQLFFLQILSSASITYLAWKGIPTFSSSLFYVSDQNKTRVMWLWLPTNYVLTPTLCLVEMGCDNNATLYKTEDIMKRHLLLLEMTTTTTGSIDIGQSP